MVSFVFVAFGNEQPILVYLVALPDYYFCISARYENTKEIWKPKEVLYIATDERNQTFFDEFRHQHSGPLRFFDDYKELAGLDSIDPTKYGMIDTVVASRGSVFAGTWFSTFSGYIVRLRGYYGMSKFYTYYSYMDKKFFMHNWMNVGDGSLYAREYPTGWTSIDGDVFVDNDNEADRGPGERGWNPFPRDDMDKQKAEATKKMITNRYIGGTEDDKVSNSSSAQDDGNLARGIAKFLKDPTPALNGAKRGHVTCDKNVDNMAYWNDPQGTRDRTFETPFGHSSSKPKYLVFTPDKVRHIFVCISVTYTL